MLPPVTYLNNPPVRKPSKWMFKVERKYAQTVYMNTKHWGKAFWTSLFSVVLSYPEQPDLSSQHHYKRYFDELRYVLPCKKCRLHFRNTMRQIPINPYLRGGRKSLFYWLLRVHNKVNNDNGLPMLTEAQVISRYLPTMTPSEISQLWTSQAGGAPDQPDDDKTWMWPMVIAAGAALLIFG